MVAVAARARELTQAYEPAAGTGKPKYGQIAVSVDDDEARRGGSRTSAFASRRRGGR